MAVKNPNRFGTLMMLGASLCFSTGGILCKFIPWSPLTISGVRSIFSLLVFGLYLLLAHHKLKFNPTVLFGALCMFGVSTLFIVANKLTTAANAIILQYTAPVWIILFMAVLFHVRPKKLDVITIFIVVAGIVCFFLDSIGSGNMMGNICAVLAGMCYAVVFMLNQFPKGDSISSIFFGQVLAAIVLSPNVIHETNFEPKTLIAVFLLGAVQVGCAYIFFSLGTKYIQPVTASLINGLEPVLNPIWVALFYGELITPLSMVGAVIVVGAILVYNVIGARMEAASGS